MEKILIIDDDVQLSKLIQEFLETFNYEIKKFYEPGLALKFLEKNSVDLIIMLGTIEHAYDLNKSIKECKRVLRDRGKILIRWRSNKLWGSPIEYFNSNHYRYFNHESIKYMANLFKLKLILRTDLEIENKPGAEYFILEKDMKYKSNEKIKKDIYKKVANDFKNYENLYFNRASNFLKAIQRSDFSVSVAKNYIKNKRNNYRALSYSDEHIFRAVIEAKEYMHYVLDIR